VLKCYVLEFQNIRS